MVELQKRDDIVLDAEKKLAELLDAFFHHSPFAEGISANISRKEGEQ